MDATNSRTYTVEHVVCVVGVIPITEFMSITVSSDKDSYRFIEDKDGNTIRLKNRNTYGTVRIQLMPGSYFADLLSLHHMLGVVVPITVKLLNGTTLHFMKNATLTKVPDTTYASDITSVEWVYKGTLVINHLGASLW